MLWSEVGLLNALLMILLFGALHVHIRGVIKKCGECLNKKNYYSKRHIAINPPQNTPPRFEHTYPIVFATF